MLKREIIGENIVRLPIGNDESKNVILDRNSYDYLCSLSFPFESLRFYRKGVCVRNKKRSGIFLGRMLFCWHYKTKPRKDLFIVPKNGNVLDMRIKNLQIIPHGTHLGWEQEKVKSKTGHKYIYHYKGRFTVWGKKGKKVVYLGFCDTIEEAVKIRREFEAKK